MERDMASIIFSAKDIFEQEFGREVRGYSKVEVDEFLDDVIKDYETYAALVKSLRQEIADLKDEEKELKSQWKREKEEAGKVAKINEEIEKIKLQIEEAQRKNDYNKLAELQYGKLPELEKQKEVEEEKAKDNSSVANKLLKQEIDSEEIAEVVGKWTGIPVAKLLQGEREKILHLAEHMMKE